MFLVKNLRRKAFSVVFLASFFVAIGLSACGSPELPYEGRLPTVKSTPSPTVETPTVESTPELQNNILFYEENLGEVLFVIQNEDGEKDSFFLKALKISINDVISRLPEDVARQAINDELYVRLGVVSGRSQGSFALARYDDEVNMVIVNYGLFKGHMEKMIREGRVKTENSLTYLVSGLNETLSHELGHAWFEHAGSILWKEYFNFFMYIGKIEGSPEPSSDRMLKNELLAVSPGELSNTELSPRASIVGTVLREDFAESFQIYFDPRERLENVYPMKFSWFCDNVAEIPRCPK